MGLVARVENLTKSYGTERTRVDALRGMWSGVTQVNPRFATPVALAVSPAQGISLRIEPSEIVLGPSLKATVKVIAQRAAGFDAPIKLATSPEKDGLPPNIAIELKPIDGETGIVRLTWTVVNQDEQAVLKANAEIIWRRAAPVREPVYL